MQEFHWLSFEKKEFSVVSFESSQQRCMGEGGECWVLLLGGAGTI